MFRQQQVDLPAPLAECIARLRAALASDADDPDLAAFQRELTAIEAAEAALPGWHGVLRLALVARLHELLYTLRACRSLRRRLMTAERRPARRRPFRHLRVTRHIDQGLALLSAGTAFISILARCAVWIGTGWTNGASMPMIAAVGCSFFAAQDMRAHGQRPELEPSDALREQLDYLLKVVARTVSDHRDAMMLALAGIRVIPFRNHSDVALR